MDAKIEPDYNGENYENLVDENFIAFIYNDSDELKIENCLNTQIDDDCDDNHTYITETDSILDNENINDDRVYETILTTLESPTEFESLPLNEVEILLNSQQCERECKTELDNGCYVDIPFLDHCSGFVDCEQGVGKVVEIPLTVSEIASSSHIITGRRRRTRRKGGNQESVIRRRKQKRERKIEEGRKPLWQFMLGILNKGGLRVLEWVNRPKGVFRILDGQSLTQLWVATRRKVCSDKFEFLTRALRHYYSKGILKKVGRKKNIYQFGEKVDW